MAALHVQTASSSAMVAVIGLGYVGLPLAVEFGKLRATLGFDINPSRIAELRAGQDHTLEVTAADLSAANHLTYNSQTEDLKCCGIFIVTVPTPIDDANRPDLTPLVKASQTVGQALQPGAVVIYESTVYPGCTEEVCVQVLKHTSSIIVVGIKGFSGSFVHFQRYWRWLPVLRHS